MYEWNMKTNGAIWQYFERCPDDNSSNNFYFETTLTVCL